MTIEQLDNEAILDLLCDARAAERQAIEGPFYPERQITAESLRAYAAKCHAMVAKYRNVAPVPNSVQWTLANSGEPVWVVLANISHVIISGNSTAVHMLSGEVLMVQEVPTTAVVSQMGGEEPAAAVRPQPGDPLRE